MSGGQGGDGAPFANGANGGAGGSVFLSNGQLNMTGGQINLSGGAGGAGGPGATNGLSGAAGSININGGLFNLTGGLVSGRASPSLSADPISLVMATVAITDGGTLNINDNATMNGGFLTRGPASDFNLAPGKRFTAANNAQIDLLDNILQIHDNRTFQITNGSTLTVEIFLGVGLESSGTLLVDNATVETGSAGPFNAQWGIGVGHADVTIRNNATANFNNHIQFVGSGAPGHSGTFQLQSGADMTVRNFRIATNSSGNGTVLVDGDGTTLTQIGAATLDLGASSSNTATLDVTNNAVYTTGAGLVSINPTGTLTIDTGATFNANAATTIDGAVNLAGGLIDATTINLNPAGDFNFTGGKLHFENFNGSLVNDGGTTAPGHSIGLSSVSEDYIQNSGGALEIEIAGLGDPGSPDGHDLLQVVGDANLAGDLIVSLLSFTPDPLDSFTVLTAGTLSGSFGNVLDGARLDTLGGEGSFLVSYDSFSNNVVLSDFLGPGLPGDFDLDGDVDGTDFMEWQRNPSVGNLADWQANYGAPTPAPSASSSVPEPNAWLLALSVVLLQCSLRQSCS